jgi:hypothetical protein
MAINDAITYYSMDNADVSGTVLYDAAGSNNGTLNNITASAGKIIGSRSFNGSSSYIAVPQQVITDILVNGTWSISCWIKHGATIDAQGEYIFAGGNGGTNLIRGIGFLIGNTGTVRAYVGYSGSSPVAVSSATVNDDAWHHVVATYDGTTIKLYIDNTPDGSISAPTPTWSTANNVEIGKLSTTRYWDGLIDEFAIYDRALSVTEVSNLWNGGNGTNPYNILDDALVYLPFDTDGSDVSGNNNDGSLNNGASISTSVKVLGDGSVSLDNDSGNQLVDLSSHINDIATNTTGSFSFWFRLNDKTASYGIVGVGDFGNLNERLNIIYLQSTDELLISLKANNVFVIDFQTVTTGFWQTNTWYHLVYKQDGVSSKLYINGEEMNISGGSNVNSGNWFANMTQTLDTFRIGTVSYADSNFIDGYVDEFAYYTRALTLTQIRHLYNGGIGFNPFAAPAALDNAVIYLSFDQDANDSSGNGNNGTLTNGASIDTTTKKVGSASLNCDNDSGDQYVNLNAHVSAVASDQVGSFAFWFRLNEKNRLQGLVTLGDFGSTSSRFRIAYFNTPDELLIGLNNGSWLLDYTTVTGGFSINTWYHVVLVQDGVASKLYLNGQQVDITGGANVNTGGWIGDITNIDTFRIGARSYSNDWFLDGNIDEFAYYNRALTPFEISALYNNGVGNNPYQGNIPLPVDVTDGNQTWQMTLNDGYGNQTVDFFRTQINTLWSPEIGSAWVGGWTYNNGTNDTNSVTYFSTKPSQQDIIDTWQTDLNE